MHTSSIKSRPVRVSFRQFVKYMSVTRNRKVSESLSIVVTEVIFRWKEKRLKVTTIGTKIQSFWWY